MMKSCTNITLTNGLFQKFRTGGLSVVFSVLFFFLGVNQVGAQSHDTASYFDDLRQKWQNDIAKALSFVPDDSLLRFFERLNSCFYDVSFADDVFKNRRLFMTQLAEALGITGVPDFHPIKDYHYVYGLLMQRLRNRYLIFPEGGLAVFYPVGTRYHVDVSEHPFVQIAAKNGNNLPGSLPFVIVPGGDFAVATVAGIDTTQSSKNVVGVIFHDAFVKNLAWLRKEVRSLGLDVSDEWLENFFLRYIQANEIHHYLGIATLYPRVFFLFGDHEVSEWIQTKELRFAESFGPGYSYFELDEYGSDCASILSFTTRHEQMLAMARILTVYRNIRDHDGSLGRYKCAAQRLLCYLGVNYEILDTMMGDTLGVSRFGLIYRFMTQPPVSDRWDEIMNGILGDYTAIVGGGLYTID